MLHTEHHIESGGERMDATLYVPDITRTHPLVALVVHGYQEDRGWGTSGSAQICSGLAANGINALAIDLRGHGTSEGNPKSRTMADGTVDILNGLQAALRITGKEKALCIARSYAAPLAIRAASLAPNLVAGIVLEQASIYTDEAYDKSRYFVNTYAMRRFRAEITEASNCEPITLLRDYKKPVLHIVSGNDKQVPVSVTRAYAHAAERSTIYTINNAFHVLNVEQINESLGAKLAWIRQEFPYPLLQFHRPQKPHYLTTANS